MVRPTQVINSGVTRNSGPLDKYPPLSLPCLPSPGASEEGEPGQRLLPQLLGRGAVLPRKFVDVTDWR